MNVFYKIKTIVNRQFLNENYSEILKGTIWSLGGRISAAGIGLIVSMLIARKYGAEMMGIVSLINLFFAMASIVTVLGADISILRLIPEYTVKYSKASAYSIYHKAQYLSVWTSLVTGGLYFIACDAISRKVFHKPNLSYYISLASAFLVFNSSAILSTSAVRAMKLLRTLSLMQILPQVFNLGLLSLLGLFVFSKDVPIYAMLGSLVLAGVTGVIIVEYSFKTKVRSNEVAVPVKIKKILSVSLPMLMTAVLNFTISQTGILMLGIFKSTEDVGHYSVAVRMATLTTFILSAVDSMSAPKFSELFHSGKIKELFHIAKKSSKLIFWATTPIFLGLIVFGRLVIRLAFGEEFCVAYWAMVVLVLGQFVNSISGPTGFFLNMTGSAKIYKNIMIFVAVINIGLNYGLIGKIGIMGAAVAAMVSQTLWNLIALTYIKIKYGKGIGYLGKL